MPCIALSLLRANGLDHSFIWRIAVDACSHCTFPFIEAEHFAPVQIRNPLPRAGVALAASVIFDRSNPEEVDAFFPSLPPHDASMPLDFSSVRRGNFLVSLIPSGMCRINSAKSASHSSLSASNFGRSKSSAVNAAWLGSVQ